MAKEKNSSSVHNGHRERIRERYQRSGMDDMAEHEVLELLLVQAIPRIDVNPIAHRLLDRFETLDRVFDASIEELKSVDGIGDKAALHIRMQRDFFRRYQLAKATPREAMDTLPKVGEYLQALFTGETVEKLYLLLLDNSMHLQKCVLIAEGTVNHVEGNLRKILEMCIGHHTASVILAHNHPRGLAIPSRDDLETTSVASELLHRVDIPLLEHIIVSDFSYSPTMHNQRGSMRISSIGEETFNRFYGITPENTP